MEIRFHKKLYHEQWSRRRLARVKRKVRKRSPKLNLFLVTLPLGAQGLLEIYWYPELLEPHYQNMNREVMVVGVADSREAAYDLVVDIIEDVGVHDGGIPVSDYFHVREAVPAGGIAQALDPVSESGPDTDIR